MRAVELEHTVTTVGWVRDPVESAAGPLLKEQGFDTFYVPMYKRGDPTFCRQVLEEAPRAGRMQAARVLPLLEQHGISRRRLRDLKLGLPIMLPDGRERVDKTTPKLSEARRSWNKSVRLRADQRTKPATPCSTLLFFLGSELRAEDYVEKFTTCAAISVARLPYVCISSASPCSPGCLPHRRKLAILSDTRDSSAAAPHTAGADLLVHEVRPNGSRWHSSESRLHLRLISLHLNCSSSAYRLQLLLQATNACTDEDRRRGLTEREVRRTTVEQGSW